MIITEDYVTVEQAKILKDKGFPQELYSGAYYYDINGKQSIFTGVPLLKPEYICPTLSLVQKWFRTQKDIIILPKPKMFWNEV